MSKPAKPGGHVQISRKRYTVIKREGYTLDGYCFLEIEDDDGDRHTAKSEDWRGYRGPWKLTKD